MNRQISHSMLATFQDCHMKYWKRYHQNITWSVDENDDGKKGIAFHRLSQAWFSGLQTDTDVSEMKAWLDVLKKSFPKENATYYPEQQVQCDININGSNSTLLAKIDLMQITSEGIAIVDYKTGKVNEKSDHLNSRMSLQEEIYLFVVAEKLMLDHQIRPLKMLFWSPIHGLISARNYDYNEHEQNRNKIYHLIENLDAFQPNSFTKPIEEATCLYCPYQRICV